MAAFVFNVRSNESAFTALFEELERGWWLAGLLDDGRSRVWKDVVDLPRGLDE